MKYMNIMNKRDKLMTIKMFEEEIEQIKEFTYKRGFPSYASYIRWLVREDARKIKRL